MSTLKEIPSDISAILTLHLGKEFTSLEVTEMLEGLRKRRSRYWVMIAVNALALLFFSYSFIYEITQLNSVVYYALGTVFVLNVLLIFHQRKQINLAIEYLEAQ
ncbi:MAG: hypothetical protein JJU41_09250 [Bacteroidetes bacterium]|nr:hypothetical protein [Bacteroidota bacterium]MCH8524176.1 hypothetical protein [Balneolales bacterium]